MALLGNYSVILKNPATFIGGTQVSNCRNAFGEIGQLRQRYYPETTDGLPQTTGLAQGYRPHYSWLIPYEAGALTSTNVNGEGEITNALGQNGYPVTSTLAGVGTISNAAGALIVEMVATIAGLGGLTASVIGQIQASATLAGTGTVTAAQSALAGMVAALTGTGLLSDAQQEALGEMTADIYVNQSEATVIQIVEGVWNALAAEYNLPATMGEAMNAAGVAGNPWTDTTTYGAGTKGKLLQDAADSAELASIS
jgi:hypothetical protein